MAKVYFDLSAATNGTGTPNNPKNTFSGYTFVAGDEHYFRRGNTFTGAFSIAAGLPGRRTKFAAWYNQDGSDDQTKAKPIFNLTTGISTFSSTNKDNVDISSLDIRCTFASVTADTAAVFLGHNSTISNCTIDCNLGCIAAFNKGNVGIYYNTVSGVSYVGTQNNNVVIASSSLAVDGVNIIGNRIIFKSGGGTATNALRAEGVGTFDMTSLVVADNDISPPDGVTYTTNLTAFGIRLQRCNGAKIMRNKVRGMLSGMFAVASNNVPMAIYVGYNTFTDNLNFGIHMTTDMIGCTIEFNDCSRNGTNNTGASAYGRGIELSSAAGQGRCGYHIVRFNVCNYNKNYGGPADNGTEGVGIGLDDGTMGCLVYGNICSFNEGNGLQYYGGNSNVTWTDTGANHVVGNYFESNGTASFTNRRTGGVAETLFVGHIHLSSTYGSKTHVANNVMVGGKLGVYATANSANFEISNNIFTGVANGVAFAGSGTGCYNNIFFKNALGSMNNYATVTTTSGALSFAPLAYTGTNDSTADPLLDSKYRPKVGSPAIGTGRAIGNFKDASGRQFKATPSIGMYESYPATLLALHN